MIQPGRKYSASISYRYGFNGKENDNEVKGDGNQQDYGFRIYDPRLGRFLSVDPLTKGYPMLTPYQFASNTPISAIDIDGKESEVVVDKMNKTMTVTLRYRYTDVEENLLKQKKLSSNDLSNAYYHYWKPGENGLPNSLVEIQEKTGFTPEYLDKMQKGGAARGGDGYFNVDFGNGDLYKVFYKMEFSKEFDRTTDPTVNTLEVDPSTDQSQHHNRVLTVATLKGLTRFHLGHEPGHQVGLVDYYEKSFQDIGYHAFQLGERFLRKVVTKDGYKSYSVGEVMDGGTFQYISTESIKVSLLPALALANREKEHNKVTIYLGGVSYPADYKISGNADREPSKVLKKENIPNEK